MLEFPHLQWETGGMREVFACFRGYSRRFLVGRSGTKWSKSFKITSIHVDSTRNGLPARVFGQVLFEV